jgi:hypothetical protein
LYNFSVYRPEGIALAKDVPDSFGIELYMFKRLEESRGAGLTRERIY